MERLLTLYSEVQSTDVRWLWYPFIAIGKITLLQGDPGDGKSTMMMNLIAELSTGGKTPDGCKIGAPQKVIYQCSEDGVSDTIKPRLERCGADCGKIAFINEEVYNGLTLDDERMRAGILDGIQTIIPTAAAVLLKKRQMLRLTQQEIADRAKITLRQYQRLESGERSILTCSFGLACRVIEALDMDVSKFYHGDYYLEEVKTMRGKGVASRIKLSI